MDTATDMVDLIQPLLSRELWDWHVASTARILMKWAGLLSIVAMDETPAESWQKAHLDYLSHMPFASTLEGSPKGHPWNVNIRYIHGSIDMIDSTQIERNAGKLEETFSNLCAAKPPQVPIRQTTANAVAVLHGVQVVTMEVKSSSDKNDAGFNQQALLMTDFFACRDPECGPLAIGLHMNASKIHLQTLELDKKNGGGYKTMMRCKVYCTEGYRLRLRLAEALKQEPKAVPRFTFRGPNSEEKCVDALAWGDIHLRFHSFVIAVIQALHKLHQLYTINEYGTYAVSNNMELTNNHVWTNVVPLPHRTDRPDELDASVQDVFFDSEFKVWEEAQRVSKKCRVETPK